MRAILLMLVLTLSAMADAQEVAAVTTPHTAQVVEVPVPRGFLRETLAVSETGGWGGSAITNVGAFYFNGDYALFSAGAGFGLSYKTSGEQYPIEIGGYVAPQLAGTDKETTASVSSLVHISLLQAFGVGIGYRFWEKGIGVVGADKSRLFFTLGYSLTNERKPATKTVLVRNGPT